MAKNIKQFEKVLDFIIEKAENEEQTGIITGTLVNHSVLDSYGDMFAKESIDNLDISGNKFLLHMHNWADPVGTLLLEKTIDSNLKFSGQFDLSKNENGNYINENAGKLYSLLKQGAPYQMSVGGYIKKGSYEDIETDKGTIRAYVIKEFDIVEGSLVLRGAVPGATVETVKINNSNNEEEFTVNKEEILALITKTVSDAFNSFEKGDLENLKTKINEFSELKTKVEGMEKDSDVTERLSAVEQMLKDTQDLIRNGSNIEGAENKADREEFVKYLRNGDMGNLVLANKIDRGDTGALIPELLSNEILKNLKDQSAFFMAGHMYTGSSNEIQIPVRVDRDGQKAVEGVAEGAGNTKDGELEYTRLTIGAGQLQSRFPLTDECREDVAFDIIGEITEATGEDFGESISDLTIRGVVTAGSVNQIAGFMNNNNVPLYNSAGAKVVPADLVKLKNKIKAKHRVGAAYYVSTELFEEMELWEDKNGRPLLVPTNATVPTQVGATPYTYKGFPVIVDDYLDEPLTGKMPAFFGNFKDFYAYYWRKGFTSEQERKANERITNYYTRTRLGGKVRYPKRGARLQVS